MRIAAALLALMPAASLAQPAPGCPPRGAPAVTMELADPEPRLMPARPSAALRAEAGGASHGEFPFHLGVTTSRVEWRSEISVRTLGPPRGPVCAVPGEVRLRLSHVEHTVRLATEVPPGGCLEAEVLEHERRHVVVNRRTLRDAAAAIEARTRRWAERAEARAPDGQAAAAMLQEELRRAIEPELERLRRTREAAHATIDTTEEYRRIGRVCPGDQQRLRAAVRGN